MRPSLSHPCKGPRSGWTGLGYCEVSGLMELDHLQGPFQPNHSRNLFPAQTWCLQNLAHQWLLPSQGFTDNSSVSVKFCAAIMHHFSFLETSPVEKGAVPSSFLWLGTLSCTDTHSHIQREARQFKLKIQNNTGCYKLIEVVLEARLFSDIRTIIFKGQH